MLRIYVGGRKEGHVARGWIFSTASKHVIQERAHSSLDAGFHISKTRWSALEWNEDAVQPEMVLTHSHIDNLIYIYNPFTEKMHWVNAQTNQAAITGPNLVHSYLNHTKGGSFSSGKPNTLLGNWLHLSTLSDWRFINLNQSFREALNLNPRPLEVTAKVTMNNQTVTQRSVQVYYAPQGLQRYTFTPHQAQFEDVKDHHLEEIEVTLKELDGTLVNFQSDSQCMIMLHFKQFETQTE